MTTKKQKRQRNLERREQFFAELQQSNAEVLAKTRVHRAQEELRAWQSNHDKNHRPNKLVAECPHCQIIKAAIKKDSGQSSQVAS